MKTKVTCISAEQYSNSMFPIQLKKTTIDFYRWVIFKPTFFSRRGKTRICSGYS